jgi:hypothetical protein
LDLSKGAILSQTKAAKKPQKLNFERVG